MCELTERSITAGEYPSRSVTIIASVPAEACREVSQLTNRHDVFQVISNNLSK